MFSQALSLSYIRILQGASKLHGQGGVEFHLQIRDAKEILLEELTVRSKVLGVRAWMTSRHDNGWIHVQNEGAHHCICLGISSTSHCLTGGNMTGRSEF